MIVGQARQALTNASSEDRKLYFVTRTPFRLASCSLSVIDRGAQMHDVAGA